jgi:hypothetical protein
MRYALIIVPLLFACTSQKEIAAALPPIATPLAKASPAPTETAKPSPTPEAKKK